MYLQKVKHVNHFQTVPARIVIQINYSGSYQKFFDSPIFLIVNWLFVNIEEVAEFDVDDEKF